jgi:hypothetical protein
MTLACIHEVAWFFLPSRLATAPSWEIIPQYVYMKVVVSLRDVTMGYEPYDTMIVFSSCHIIFHNACRCPDFWAQIRV